MVGVFNVPLMQWCVEDPIVVVDVFNIQLLEWVCSGSYCLDLLSSPTNTCQQSVSASKEIVQLEDLADNAPSPYAMVSKSSQASLS